MDWMIARGDRKLETAVISTLVGIRHRDWEVMALRALMACMLYPSRDMSEMEAWMRGEKYEGKALIMSSWIWTNEREAIATAMSDKSSD